MKLEEAERRLKESNNIYSACIWYNECYRLIWRERINRLLKEDPKMHVDGWTVQIVDRDD